MLMRPANVDVGIPNKQNNIPAPYFTLRLTVVPLLDEFYYQVICKKYVTICFYRIKRKS